MKRHALLPIAALCALAATDAFVSPRFAHTTTSCATTVARVPATKLLVSSDSTNETASNSISDDRSSSSSTTWTLEQDWALMDAVPKFTVGGDSDGQSRRTFWTQLVLQTPALRDKMDDGPLDGGAEDELMARYQLLRKISNENAAPLQPCGKAPPVLQRWNLDETTGRVQGEVEGRIIWVQMQTMGQFNADASSFPDARKKKGMEEMRSAPPPGGFVEAVGGRVYELGEPKQVAAAEITSSDGIPLMKNMSTVLASAVLAVAIIGLVEAPQQPASLQRQASLSTQPKVENVISKRRDIIEINNSEQSIGERRARLEAKILRDARVVKTLKETLQGDEKQLAALKIQKSSASAVSDDAEQNSLQQQISRIEARVGRTERVVNSISKRLPEERIELRKLRQLEANK